MSACLPGGRGMFGGLILGPRLLAAFHLQLDLAWPRLESIVAY